MWNYWIKIISSSDQKSIPTHKEWAIYGKDIKFESNDKFIIPLEEISSIDILTNENKKKLLGTVGGGALGWAVLGPLGGVAGILLGGNKNILTLAVNLNDDRGFIAQCNSTTYAHILKHTSYTKENNSSQDNIHESCPKCGKNVKNGSSVCRYCLHKFI